jgi:hypothetical protein
MHHSHRGTAIWVFMTALIVFLSFSSLEAQIIRVLESHNGVAFISGGKNAGLRIGDSVRIMRRRNNSWKEVSRAQITEVLPDMAKIEIMDGEPLINFRPGDQVMKMRIATLQPKPIAGTIELPSNSDFSLFSPYRAKSVYLGPTSGLFMPVGSLSRKVGSSTGYGAILGLRFRSNFDMTTRFFYTEIPGQLYFWSIQMMGRKYLDKNLVVDLGYGIGYPLIAKNLKNLEQTSPFGDFFPMISLGFSAGMGYVIELSPSIWCEVGAIGHYYPNFCGQPGAFMTIQGRLII